MPFDTWWYLPVAHKELPSPIASGIPIDAATGVTVIMFSKPKAMTYVMPAEPIDVNQRYLVKLVEIKDEGVSKFADPVDDDPAHNLRWVFRLAQLDRTPVLDIDGGAYEHHDYTSNRTGKSKTKTAKARLWAEALLGRPLEDDEIDDNLPNALRNNVATCLFEEVERGGQDGTEAYLKLRILRLSPYRPGAKPDAAPPPKPVPPPAAVANDGLPW